MQRSSFKFSYDGVPSVLIELTFGDRAWQCVGEIDSGSDTSLCPLLFAEVLGISKQDLTEDEGEAANGTKFPIWRPKGQAILGQIMVSKAGEEAHPWGEMFSMDLIFCEGETLLLGRGDFFSAFDLQFLNEDGEQWLHISKPVSPFIGP